MTMTMTRRLQHAAYRLRGAVREGLSATHARTHLRAFQEFHASLADRRDIVYMFFTSDLLHWLSRALSFVPAEANLVLIGSDLTPEEQAWVAGTGRPFHCVAERVDDNAVLELVWQTARHNFGWLHIDCFVLNPALFAEMMRFAPDVAMNCIWTEPGPVETLHSAFVTVHYDVLQAIRRAGIQVSPCTYEYRGSPTGRTPARRPLYSRVPSFRHVELLSRLLPLDGSGVPAHPEGGCFEILELYQLVANALGYKLHQVRRLRRDGTGSAAHYSNEIIHVNGVSTYKRYRKPGARKSYIDDQEYLLLLQADYAVLLAMGEEAPRQYAALRFELARQIEGLGLTDAQVVDNLSGFLAARGVSAESCARILAAA